MHLLIMVINVHIINLHVIVKSYQVQQIVNLDIMKKHVQQKYVILNKIYVMIELCHNKMNV